jgi:hypothetical protein
MKDKISKNPKRINKTSFKMGNNANPKGKGGQKSNEPGRNPSGKGGAQPGEPSRNSKKIEYDIELKKLCKKRTLKWFKLMDLFITKGEDEKGEKITNGRASLLMKGLEIGNGYVKQHDKDDGDTNYREIANNMSAQLYEVMKENQVLKEEIQALKSEQMGAEK